MVGDDRRQSVDQSKLPVGTCRNAAVTIFLQMLGEENGTSLSLSVAGMADPVLASRVASTTNLYAITAVCTMPVSESLLCGE